MSAVRKEGKEVKDKDGDGRSVAGLTPALTTQTEMLLRDDSRDDSLRRHFIAQDLRPDLEAAAIRK